MMHGTISPQPLHPEDRSRLRALVGFVVDHRRWLLIVALPTLLVAAYYGTIVANQYESEAHILVKSTQANAAPVTGLGAALSMIGGVSTTPIEAATVSDYLSSHDAVDTLRRRIDLVDMFRRPEADLGSKLLSPDPSPEKLLRYFRGHVDVKLSSDTGIISIRVRTFRPQDSYQLSRAMLAIGEERVNILNQRAYASTLQTAQRQLHEAEDAIASAQRDVTAFRQARHNIDPVATGQAQIGVVSSLQEQLAQARAQLSAMSGVIDPQSPQARAMTRRVGALQTQVSTESQRLTGGSSAIAANVGDYQGLLLRQQFASKRYDEAAAAVQRAREQAQKQQLFIVPVVEPNMPVKALYPRSFKIIVTIFFGLALAYALGWLIAAGVREHAA